MDTRAEVQEIMAELKMILSSTDANRVLQNALSMKGAPMASENGMGGAAVSSAAALAGC